MSFLGWLDYFASWVVIIYVVYFVVQTLRGWK